MSAVDKLDAPPRSDEHEEICSGAELFSELDGYYRPEPEPKYEEFQSWKGRQIRLRLLGKHPLWGHCLWNASKVMAELLEQEAEQGVRFSTLDVLEVGAGAGLPSMISIALGSRSVVASDYPDEDLIENLRFNVESGCKLFSDSTSRASVVGHIWGKSVSDLIEANQGRLFHRILLSDLIFNHTYQKELLQTCRACLEPSPVSFVWVTFSHHRPKLSHLDLRFFEFAKEFGFRTVHCFSRRMTPMFEEDEGPEEVRATVHVYKLLLEQTEVPNLSVLPRQ